MKIRHSLAALAVIGGVSVSGAAPAFASGPPVPPGCSFDQATGVETCTTTTTTYSYIGPFTAPNASPSDTFGGFTGYQLCAASNQGYPGDFVYLYDYEPQIVTTTTTTTERHGLNGKVFYTSTSTSSTPDGNSEGSGFLACF